MLNLIENEIVIQTVAIGSKFTLPNGDVVSPAYAGWSNGECELVEVAVSPAPEPEPHDLRTGMRLSFAQLLIGLVSEQWITEADGNGWLTGVLPPSVEATINLIPADQRFAARARAARPSEVMRLDPLVQRMALAQNRSPEEVDDFFARYAAV
jgi:hypothetical protein